MGTRSLTYFFQDGKPFCAFYRQMDGYPSGHGADLGEILAPITLVNGYGFGMKAGEHANGPGCLAAQVIAKLKDSHGIGGIYMIAPELNGDHWQEYEYHVHCNSNSSDDVFAARGEDAYTCYVEVRDPKDLIFRGTFEDFYKWAQNAPQDAEGNYIPTINKVEAPKVKPELRVALKQGVVTVVFTKASGERRVMKCTQDFELIPEDKHPGASGRIGQHDPHLFKVFDLEKNDWRSFREPSVISYKVA